MGNTLRLSSITRAFKEDGMFNAVAEGEHSSSAAATGQSDPLGVSARTARASLRLRVRKHVDPESDAAPGDNDAVRAVISHGGIPSSADGTRYSMCSLLLRVGRILGVRPSHAPSPRVSSIFDRLLEEWSLCREGGGGTSVVIDRPSDIVDGDELILCCGDFARECSDGPSANDEVDMLLSVIPAKYGSISVLCGGRYEETDGHKLGDGERAPPESAILNVEMKTHVSRGGQLGLSGSSDSSSVEDVTDLMKPPASPEIIDLMDDSDGESFGEGGTSQSTYGDGTESTSSDSDGDSDSEVEDVTDQMMATRKEHVRKMMEEAEEIHDSDDEGETTTKKRKRRARSRTPSKRKKTRKNVQPPVEVIMEDGDMPMCPGANAVEEGNCVDAGENDDVDHAIKQRIVKLLNTGFHEDSNEHEARNAMKLARRLMERYNLDQAVLMQERGDGSLNHFSTGNDNSGTALRGGMVTVEIRNRKRKAPLSSLPRWIDYLVSPVSQNFRVEAFKTMARASKWRKGKCSVTFYGVRSNAQLAAYAFKVATEKISHMAAMYDPPGGGDLSRAKRAVATKAARLSYALGVLNGLKREVEEGLRREEERRAAKLRRAKRAARTGEAYHEDDEYGDDGDGENDSASVESSEGEESECGGSEGEDAERDGPQICDDAAERLDRLERENNAHLALVDHHKKVASDVLKDEEIKVRSSRKRKPISLNRKAYAKGVIDSKEIDLNQRAIGE